MEVIRGKNGTGQASIKYLDAKQKNQVNCADNLAYKHSGMMYVM